MTGKLLEKRADPRMNRLLDIPLLPCPFCGASAVITTVTHAEFNRFYVICTNTRCACSLVPRNSANQAAADWNRRLITLRASLNLRRTQDVRTAKSKG